MTRPGLRLVVAAFGDAGHAFPAMSLAAELHSRGHQVVLESWEQWRGVVEGLGLEFRAAQEYTVFPPPGPDSADGRTAADAARALAVLMEEWEPDLVVSDILTLAPTLAAEVAGVPHATLIPHVYPVMEPGQSMYSLGFAPARTPLGRAGWRATIPILNSGLKQGRDEMNETRRRLGLPPQERFHGGISELLAIVATFPQLEYPRRWPEHVKVTGPLFFEKPSEEIEIPEGDEPLVLIAPSTAQDPECLLLRTALEALEGLPLRVVSTYNNHTSPVPIHVPDNAVMVPWLRYSQVMPPADLVICHGGHGTVARALGYGTPVLACPAAGDMGENGARLSWSGAGLPLPRRLLSQKPVRLAAMRVLEGDSYRETAEEIGRWSETNDGAANAADEVEAAARRASGRRSTASL